jgi:NTE family protein
MKIPFAAVAVDVATGQVVSFRRGPVAPAVHASCAIPGVFVPVEIGGRTYVDGGVVNPVPADVARSMGADVVVAVSIPALARSTVPSNPVAVAYQSVMIMSAEIGRLRAREADVVISPDVGDVAYDDFTQKKRLIAAGEEAARKALPQIRALLAAKTRRVPLT